VRKDNARQSSAKKKMKKNVVVAMTTNSKQQVSLTGKIRKPKAVKTS